MTNGIKPMTKLDNGTSLKTEDIVYPLTTNIRNKIVTTINSENSKFTPTIPSGNYNTTDSLHVTGTIVKGSTKTSLSTTEPVLATHVIIHNNIVVEDHTLENILKSRTNESLNEVTNSVETDVSLMMENIDTTKKSSTPLNNGLTKTTTGSNPSKETFMTSQANISANKVAKSVVIDIPETNVSLLMEDTTNIKTTNTPNPSNNRLTKSTTSNSSIETFIASEENNMSTNKITNSVKTGFPVIIKGTTNVTTTNTSNSPHKSLSKSPMTSTPSIEIVNCDLLRKFRCVPWFVFLTINDHIV